MIAANTSAVWTILRVTSSLQKLLGKKSLGMIAAMTAETITTEVVAMVGAMTARAISSLNRPIASGSALTFELWDRADRF
jgi:hypothetical protein